VALRTKDVSEELVASIISELATMLAVTTSSNTLSTLMMEAIHSSETSGLIRATRRNIPEDDILQSHCPENLKSYNALTGWTL
jgi:hypothetical protein